MFNSLSEKLESAFKNIKGEGRISELNFVKGVRVFQDYTSFPSGHTISAFCALALVGFISKKPWVQFLLFLLACLSGYSRVYAAQHYLMDVYAGAIFGFTVALIVYHIFTNNFKTPFWSQPLIKF